MAKALNVPEMDGPSYAAMAQSKVHPQPLGSEATDSCVFMVDDTKDYESSVLASLLNTLRGKIWLILSPNFAWVATVPVTVP